MANTIKLKRGSGSNPTASDLDVGELAIRTDEGKIFTKKDNGNVAEISGGGGIDDGDKGDITVSNNGDTWTIDNDAVTYAKIQNVSATDRLLGRDSSGAGVIEEISPSSVRTMLGLATSATTDTTNADNISSGTLAAGRVATLNQDTTGSAATLTTARTIAGTSFDGSANIDISYANLTNKLSVGDGGLTQNNFTNTLKSKLDGIESGATADQSAAEILTAIKTVDGSGSGLDADTCDGQHLGTSADVQFGSVKAGGNAFKIDSYNTNDLRIQGTAATGAQGILGTDSAGDFKYQLYGTGSYVGFLDGAWANWDLKKQLGGQLELDVGGNLYTVYHGGNLTVGDGGLTQNNFTNALKSKLDGIASSATNVTNNNQLTNGAGYITATLTEEQVEDYVGGMVTGNTETGITVTYQDSDGTLDFVVASQTDNNFTTTLKNKLDGIATGATNVTNNNQLTNGASYITSSGTSAACSGNAATATALATARTIAGTSFDGSANIDISYNDLTNKLSVGDGGLTQNNFTNTLKSKLDGIESGATADQTASEILTLIKTVDGTGSGLDADLLDGSTGADYLNYNNFTNTPTIPTNNNQLTNGAGYITATLTEEQVEDYVGGMVTGNTETGITVTYQDSDGTLDFVVASQTDNNFTTALKNKLDGIAASATNVTNNNQLTNGAGYITSATANDGIFWENNQNVTSNYTITNGKNAMTAGPITIDSGVTVTIGSGEYWTIL